MKNLFKYDVYGIIDKFFTPKLCLIIVLALIALYVAIFTGICVQKYVNFEYHDWDFAISTNILWNLTQGSVHSSLLGENFLKDHANFIAFFLAPLYFIFRHPAFLLFLQSAFIGISAFPIYLVGRRKLGDAAGAAIALIYLFYPTLHYANLYEVNFEVFVLPFFSFAFYFLLVNKTWPFIAMCVGACLCKENTPLTVAMLGLFGLTRPNRRMLGGIALLLGVSFFFFDIQLLPKILSFKNEAAPTTKYIYLFSKYGDTPIKIIHYMATHPLDILDRALSGKFQEKFFQDILGPLYFLPLLRPDVFLINAPHILMRLLGRNPLEHTVYFHSAAPLAPFTILALTMAFSTLRKNIRGLKNYIYPALAIIFILELVQGYRLWQERPAIVRFRLEKEVQDLMRDDMVNAVPEGASVMASFKFLSHLANREKVTSLHKYFGVSWVGKNPPSDLEYVLIDMNDRLLRGMSFFNDAVFAIRLWPYLSKNGFALVRARGDMLLFKKGPPQEEALFTGMRIDDDLAQKQRSLMKVDDNLSLLLAYGDTVEGSGDLMKLTFYWYAENVITADYGIQIFITEGKHDIPLTIHALGYLLLPTRTWPKGYIVKENYWLILPRLSQGEHTVSFRVINITEGKKAKIIPMEKSKIDQRGKYKLITFERRNKSRQLSR